MNNENHKFCRRYDSYGECDCKEKSFESAVTTFKEASEEVIKNLNDRIEELEKNMNRLKKELGLK